MFHVDLAITIFVGFYFHHILYTCYNTLIHFIYVEGVMSDRDCSLPKDDSTQSLSTDELRFDTYHGSNAVITQGGKTALRPNAHSEFNDAIVITNRPLRDNELFEITVDHMINRWSGSIEAGEFY